MEKKFEKLMETELVKKLSNESEATIKGTFDDFNPEYSEWVIAEIENIYGYDCSNAGDLDKIEEVEEKLMDAILAQIGA